MPPGEPACRAPPGAGPGLPAFPAPRGRRGSGVNGRPQAVARQRDAQHPLHREERPRNLRGTPENSGGEAATFPKLLTS